MQKRLVQPHRGHRESLGAICWVGRRRPLLPPRLHPLPVLALQPAWHAEFTDFRSVVCPSRRLLGCVLACDKTAAETKIRPCRGKGLELADRLQQKRPHPCTQQLTDLLVATRRVDVVPERLQHQGSRGR